MSEAFSTLLGRSELILEREKPLAPSPERNHWAGHLSLAFGLGPTGEALMHQLRLTLNGNLPPYQQPDPVLFLRPWPGGRVEDGLNLEQWQACLAQHSTGRTEGEDCIQILLLLAHGEADMEQYAAAEGALAGFCYRYNRTPLVTTLLLTPALEPAMVDAYCTLPDPGARRQVIAVPTDVDSPLDNHRALLTRLAELVSQSPLTLALESSTLSRDQGWMLKGFYPAIGVHDRRRNRPRDLWQHGGKQRGSIAWRLVNASYDWATTADGLPRPYEKLDRPQLKRTNLAPIRYDQGQQPNPSPLPSVWRQALESTLRSRRAAVDEAYAQARTLRRQAAWSLAWTKMAILGALFLGWWAAPGGRWLVGNHDETKLTEWWPTLVWQGILFGLLLVAGLWAAETRLKAKQRYWRDAINHADSEYHYLSSALDTSAREAETYSFLYPPKSIGWSRRTPDPDIYRAAQSEGLGSEDLHHWQYVHARTGHVYQISTNRVNAQPQSEVTITIAQALSGAEADRLVFTRLPQQKEATWLVAPDYQPQSQANRLE